MKKLFALLLSISILISPSTTAFAANITAGSTQNSTATVTYGVDDSYTITIPDSVVIDSNTHTGNITISASDVILSSATALNVSISGNSYNNYAWHLTDVLYDDNQLAYLINDSISTVRPNDIVLSVYSGEAFNSAVSSTLTLQLIDNVTMSGNYTDTLTFTVWQEENAQELSGTYLLQLSYSQMAERALLMDSEDLEMLASDTDKETKMEFLYNKYYLELQPIKMLNEDGTMWYYKGSTPLLTTGNPDEPALWVYKIVNDGEEQLINEDVYSFYGAFSFIVSDNTNPKTLKWCKNIAQKLSANTTSIIWPAFTDLSGYVNNIDMQENITWTEWVNSALYDDDFRIVNGYVRVYDRADINDDGHYGDHWTYLTLNGEYVRANDVIQLVNYQTTLDAPEDDKVTFTVEDSTRTVGFGSTWDSFIDDILWSEFIHYDVYEGHIAVHMEYANVLYLLVDSNYDPVGYSDAIRPGETYYYKDFIIEISNS